jgi:ATPase subunit of ABC transporter with duplicated ATPase domains
VHGGGVASLQLKGVHFRYADRAGVPGESIFRGLDMGIELTTRMGLMGANGAGKSTLVKLIMGQLSPSEGEVLHPRHFKIGA